MIAYLTLSSMLKELVEQKRQLKNIIYHQNKIKPAIAYSNLSLILNNYQLFEMMADRFDQEGHSIHNKYLLFVMVAEQINTGTIKGGGKLKNLISNSIHLIPKIQKKTKINKSQINIRLREISLEEAFLFWKTILSHYPSNPVVPNMYDLQPEEYSNLVKQNPQILNNSFCMIQSMSSALPPFLLFQGLLNETNKKKKFDIIDACSAPGNKTLQLSELVGDRGQILAYQKNDKRYQTLKTNLQKFKGTNVIAKNQDFLETNPEDLRFRKVKMVLLDPSCSGSGMLTNLSRDKKALDMMESDFESYCQHAYSILDENQKTRVEKLHKFQVELLCHAAKFNPQRISFSTCSIYHRQNESSIGQFLSLHPEYRIKNVKQKIASSQILDGFGKGYKQCIRVDPRTKKSDGFFVCILSKIK